MSAWRRFADWFTRTRARADAWLDESPSWAPRYREPVDPRRADRPYPRRETTTLAEYLQSGPLETPLQKMLQPPRIPPIREVPLVLPVAGHTSPPLPIAPRPTPYPRSKPAPDVDEVLAEGPPPGVPLPDGWHWQQQGYPTGPPAVEIEQNRPADPSPAPTPAPEPASPPAPPSYDSSAGGGGCSGGGSDTSNAWFS